jgi:DEAD/DEAH box helicase domain-containing protein
VANAKPHDLYFYADPLEMMAGNVEPPKVFLKASAVLERQFLAYCMDSWIKKGVPENVIPEHIGVCLNNLTAQNTDRYPFNFLSYVQGNNSVLLRTFIQMFPELDENEKADLTNYARGAGVTDSPMHVKVLESFDSLKKQKDALLQNTKQLKKLIKDLERKPKDSSYDEEIKELKSERAALVSVRRSIDNKIVFNFLSDEGLLPNYAFPESGIILKAVLYRKEDNAGAEEEPPKKKYEKRVYEYSRSASAAISEFAPANHFYAEGRKLTINQIDLTSAQAAKWRLCPNCSHAQLEEAGRNTSSCPECGSPAWADSGQVRSMLKVQMVYSNMDYTKSLIGDESDDRQTTFYSKQLLVDVNEDEDISIAYRMDNEEFNFGYEFVKKATLREINFGESDIAGEQLTVAGQDGIRKGFKICKYCGKIQPEKGKPEHSFTCKARNSLTTDGSYEEFLFLYREFVTEALRILVPATTMDSSNTRQESFVAAFMLGMKEYFGNVDHLHATLSEVPVANADYRKQYLVIYDSIPGGTGYLKQLMLKRHSLIEIFEKALSVLENCECKNDSQKDGCYHCLFAYRQSGNIGQISRVSAIRLLKQILSGKDNLEEIPKLSMVPVNNLFESELERRFIEALSQMGNDKRPLSITNILVHNKEGYQLKIGSAVWEIEPQVKLDASFGVPAETRADFVLWPTRMCGTQKAVAVYVDGFIYHKDRVADDTLKREAVRRSGKFRVWSLSWKDVQSVFKVQGEYATDTLLPGKMPSGSKMYKPAVEAAHAEALRPEKSPAMELLAQYLANPESENLFEAHANAYAFSLLDPSIASDSTAFADWKHDMAEIQEALEVDFVFDFKRSFFGKWRPRTTNPQMTVFSGVLNDDMKNDKFNAAVSVYASLDDKEENRTDKYEQEWNGFWQFFNVMQFLKGFAAVSAVGLRNMVYSSLSAAFTEQEEAQVIADDSRAVWSADILTQILDASVKVFSSRCMERGIPSPDFAGYELANGAGLVIGEAELVWEKRKIALLLPGQEEHKNAFVSEGWTVISLEDEIQPALFEEI